MARLIVPLLRRSVRSFLLSTCLVLCACGGPGRVQFEHGQCLIDGTTASLTEVEARQAQVTRRILARQPVFVFITVLVVVLAGASHAEKIAFLFATRGAPVRGLGERIRLMLDRYRAHPVRYFAILTSTMGLLALAGGCYIYLDAEKRANERALGQLQFCHLALRTAEEDRVLDEQRRNLQTIQATAGDIRDLVDRLPPEEQHKAQEIIDKMGQALSQQGRLVGEYLHRSDETARTLRDHTQALERGLSTMEADVGTLKALPGGLRDLGEQVRRVDAALKAVDGKVTEGGARLSSSDTRLGAVDTRLGAVDTRLTSIDDSLKALAARPACPACACSCPGPPTPATSAAPRSSAGPQEPEAKQKEQK